MPNATLNSFSEFTQGKASQIRNCANEHEMRAWFEALFLEKFDGQDARAQKAWAWCSTVGRKHMLREGASEPFRPRRDVLASWPRWIRDAIKAGKPLSALSLAPSERDLFSSILDWMRSPSGPSLTSDWSKISAPQAKAAELAWIDAMAKAAAKKDLEAVDAAGTELFAPLGAGGPPSCPGSGPEWAGWRWVEVKSADALDREGALMRHCVGHMRRTLRLRKSAFTRSGTRRTLPSSPLRPRGRRSSRSRLSPTPCAPRSCGLPSRALSRLLRPTWPLAGLARHRRRTI